MEEQDDADGDGAEALDVGSETREREFRLRCRAGAAAVVEAWGTEGVYPAISSVSFKAGCAAHDRCRSAEILRSSGSAGSALLGVGSGSGIEIGMRR
ncbi:hypothetical protein [Leucobacter soli]|uniref:hypothetical protein n=1 Tax=Leucobacter soli TaxID=2812850 RepID=UPI003613836D